MAETWDEQGKPISQSWDEHGNPVGGDPLTQQTQATAKAAGAPTGPEPMPSGYEPVTAHNDETQHPNNPIYQKLAENDKLLRTVHAFQNMPSSYDTPLTNATGALGLAELPGAVANSGNWLAGHMREPATAAESLAGKAGAPKNILPRSMQRWTIPDWVAEGITPVGEKGTPTNPGPFNNIPSTITPAEQRPLPLPQRAYAEMESEIAAERQARSAAASEMNKDIGVSKLERVSAHGQMQKDIEAGQLERSGARAEMQKDIARQGKAVPLSQSPYANTPISPADRAQMRPPVPARATAPAWKGAVPEAAPAPARSPVQMPEEPPWAARGRAVKANPRPVSEIAPTAPETPGNGIYVSRMGRKWSAGDLAQMPREQLAGEYAKEIAKPVPQQDQEWMTALKAESQRNTKGMYPGAAASTKGGAKLQ